MISAFAGTGVLPSTFEVKQSLVRRHAYRVIEGGGIWDTRKTLKVMTARREARPQDFPNSSPNENIRQLARKLIGEGKLLVPVKIISQEEGIIAGHPKVFFDFEYDGRAYRLCSTHFAD